MTPTELAADRPCCAHLKISYRTEPCDGTNVRGEVVPGGAVRGWWECDSGCGARFVPAHGVTFRADAVREWIGDDGFAKAFAKVFNDKSDEMLRDTGEGMGYIGYGIAKQWLRAALLALHRGGSEQTQASLEPSQHQGVNTVAQDCDVISAPPATPGEPQDAPPDHEAFKALRTFGNESIKRSRAPTEASVEAAATWAKRARGQAQLAGEYESIIQKARRIIDRFPARLETENGEESLVSWGRRVEDWYVGLRAALGAARTEEREP